jgi:uncharacterized protein YecE (DUF72 family)
MIRIGTCSWKYNSWKGIVYQDKDNIDYLAEYSRQFNTVEIDQWFWSLFEGKKPILPKSSDVKVYANSVPDDFKFTIKIPNSVTLTHFYSSNKKEATKSNPYFLNIELFESFLQLIEPMRNKVGVLMFQFEYLNKQKMSGLTEFIDRFESFVESLDSRYAYGVEIRNPNFLKKPFFEFLTRNKLAMIFLQGYFMPPVWEVFKEFKDYIKSTSVIRLHGPDRSGIEKKTGGIWNQIVESKDDEIDKIAEMIFYLNSKQVDIFANVNNHFEGSAPLTIKKLKEKLK